MLHPEICPIVVAAKVDIHEYSDFTNMEHHFFPKVPRNPALPGVPLAVYFELAMPTSFIQDISAVGPQHHGP